jgi:alpha-galactosidase
MRGLIAIAAALTALCCAPPALALDDGLARTPPMGWSSWNHFGCDVDERQIRETADAMVANGMRAARYRYVLLDDCWMAPERGSGGRLQAHPTRFPRGIKALADYVHARGLRFGLYHDLGAKTCNGGPGIAGHEREDMRQFAGWGVDYVKVDFCFVGPAGWKNPERAYARVGYAIRETGRRMVLSVCSWGRGKPWLWGRRVGHLWRTTPDISDSWRSIVGIADRTARLARYAGPGGWNDPDSLEVGNGGMSDAEYRSHMSLWAVLAAPLIAGNDVRSMSAATRRTLLNAEVLRVDQDPAGRQGRRVSRQRGREVWVRRLRGGDRAVLLFNRGRRAARVTATPRALGLSWRRRRVRDLWARRWVHSGPVLSARVPAHGVRFLRVKD